MIREKIIELVRMALLDASKASRMACDASGETLEQTIRQEAGAVMVALRGLSSIQLAEAIVISTGQFDETDPFGEIANAYRTFVDEIADNFSTNHSHQWTSIHEKRLLDLASGTEFEAISPFDNPGE